MASIFIYTLIKDLDMLTFKKFLLQDARSHPELNPKVSINQRLIDYYDRAPYAPPHFGVEKNAWVSFTKYEKLGLNPGSEYTTPLAICSYSLEYVIRGMGEYRSAVNAVPYVGHQPFVNCFSVKGNIINVNTFSESDSKKYMPTVIQFAKDNGLTDSEIERIIKHNTSEYDSLENWSFASLKGKSMLGYSSVKMSFWTIVEKVVTAIARKRNLSSGRIGLALNTLYRKMGIDGLIDNGSGVLYPDEPFQAMFFHIGCIYNVERYDNKWSPESLSSGLEKGTAYA